MEWKKELPTQIGMYLRQETESVNPIITYVYNYGDKKELLVSINPKQTLSENTMHHNLSFFADSKKLFWLGPLPQVPTAESKVTA